MNTLEKDFIPYKEALELKDLGFNEEVVPIWYCKETKERLFSFNTKYPEKYILAPLYSQAFRFFREKYDLHVQIRKENYFHKSKYEYYHYDISRGEKNDITNQEDLHESILHDSSQDIPGNYLKDEKYRKLLFEKEFAFKTYEEIELACLRKLIEIVKTQIS